MTIVELSGDADPLAVGGKAAGLGRLAGAGLPVPPGVVVPAQAGDDEIDDLSAVVAERFAGRRLAIRSSGVAEDLAEASFAGQYETVLGVAAAPQEVAAAVRRVRASAFGPGVASYARRHDAAMAVLVMPMVDADAAGIAFTRDPITGERVVVVEAVRGLGDRLAAGETAGERWRVAGAADRVSDLGVLTEEEAGLVADLARRCEAALGGAVDVEWALCCGEVVLLQARPITTVDDVEPIPMDEEAPPGPWEWDASHNRLPITPLAASVFIPGFERGSRRLAEIYGAPIKQLAMRRINGYLYVQVVPPAGKPGAPPPPKPVMRAMFKLVPMLRQRVRAARLAAEERTDIVLRDEWRASIGPAQQAKAVEWLEMDRRSLSDAELSELLLAAVELQREAFGWNMVTDPAYLFPLVELHDFLESELGEGMETVTRLLAGAGPTEYREAVAALAADLSPEGREAIVTGDGDVVDRLEAADPEFAARYRHHLRDHGLRVMGFDLSNRTLLEDAELELSRIAALPPHDDPTPAARELAADVRARLAPEGARRFDELLAAARDAYPIREEGEAVHAKVLGIVRLIALDLGARMVDAGHLEVADHVVFLNLDEAVQWLKARGDVRALVRTRRGQHLWARGHSPEPYLGPPSPLPPIDLFPPDVQRVMRLFEILTTHDQRPADLSEGADGVAASPGVHTGPARIVMGPDDFHRVQPGDVLIAPITASPWEVLFPHVGALVTEGGGLLSHPAIVAREYGLPAVVGCEGATKRFRDGRQVRVDGAAGTVTPVDDA